jgi:hypothetical protein
MFSDWFLAKIQVQHGTKTYLFNCEQWLGKKEGDRQLERIIFEKVN